MRSTRKHSDITGNETKKWKHSYMRDAEFRPGNRSILPNAFTHFWLHSSWFRAFIYTFSAAYHRYVDGTRRSKGDIVHLETNLVWMFLIIFAPRKTGEESSCFLFWNSVTHFSGMIIDKRFRWQKMCPVRLLLLMSLMITGAMITLMLTLYAMHTLGQEADSFSLCFARCFSVPQLRAILLELARLSVSHRKWHICHTIATLLASTG